MDSRWAAVWRAAGNPARGYSTALRSSNKLLSRIRSGSDSKVHSSTSGSRSAHLDWGLIRVPTFGRASTSPLAARIRTASRYAVRDTANCSLAAISLSRRSPGAYSPETMAMPSLRAIVPCSRRALAGVSVGGCPGMRSFRMCLFVAAGEAENFIHILYATASGGKNLRQIDPTHLARAAATGLLSELLTFFHRPAEGYPSSATFFACLARDDEPQCCRNTHLRGDSRRPARRQN